MEPRLIDLGNTYLVRREYGRAQQRLAPGDRHGSEWQAWLLIVQTSAKQNDIAGARDAAQHAQEVLTILQRKWRAEAFCGYAERQDGNEWRKQMDELAAL